MIILRLLPIILADILLAAHFLRFNGIIPASLILLLLLTLFIRRWWIVRLWQVFLFAATLIWIEASFNLIGARMAMGAPAIRLIIIMAGVVLFNVFALFWLENKKIKTHYNRRK